MKNFTRFLSKFFICLFVFVLGLKFTETNIFASESYFVVDFDESTNYDATFYNYDYAFEVLEYVNEFRFENGLGPLVMDTDLMELAMRRSQETIIHFDPTRPNGKSFSSIADENNLESLIIHSENIAIGQTSAKRAFESWKNSPGHRANMLGTYHKSIGIGSVDNSWVQLYSSQKGKTASKGDFNNKRVYSNKVDVNLNIIQPKLYVYPGGTSNFDSFAGDVFHPEVWFINQEFSGSRYEVKSKYINMKANSKNIIQSGNEFILLKLGNYEVEFTHSESDAKYIFKGVVQKNTKLCKRLPNGTGWVNENGKYKYCDQMSAVQQWQKINGLWYYFDKSIMNANSWLQNGEKWYRFSSSGAMMTNSWYQNDKNEWFYLDDVGIAVRNQWKSINNKWYYFNNDFKMINSGWKSISKHWYYFSENGSIFTNTWHKNSAGDWFYFKNNGTAANSEWVSISGNWFFFDSDLKMKKPGWHLISGSWYRFKTDGSMMKSSWYQNEKGTWFYLKDNGVAASSEWVKIGDKSYYFNADTSWNSSK